MTKKEIKIMNAMNKDWKRINKRAKFPEKTIGRLIYNWLAMARMEKKYKIKFDIDELIKFLDSHPIFIIMNNKPLK